MRILIISYGGCISKQAECNGVKECVDGSDEMTAKCPKKTRSQMQGQCRHREFQCDSGQCITYDYDLCNGRTDCPDESDEKFEYCVTKACLYPDRQFRW